MNHKTTTLTALAILAFVPMASATTYTDSTGDAFLGTAYLDLESVDVTSDGTNVNIAISIADIQTDQLATRYTLHLGDPAGNAVTLNCYYGLGIFLVGNPSCQGSRTGASIGNIIGVSAPIAITWTLDAATDVITVSFAYTEIGAASGDSIPVVLAASNLLLGMYVPIPGDRLDIGVNEVLA